MDVNRAALGDLEAFINAVVRTISPDEGAARYRDDFAEWCRQVPRIDPEQYQADIGDSVVENRATMVPSCNGAGKSYIAALVIVWWLTTREDAFVVWTAPRWGQVRTVVGRYIKQVLRRLSENGVDHGLTLNDAMVLKLRGEIVGNGVSPADNDHNGISGIHATNVLVVVDEADGVKPAIWSAVDSYMTTDPSRMLAIGNPIISTSTFAAKLKLTTGGSGTRVIRIDGLRLPTMSRTGVEEFPALAAIFEREGIPYATDEDADRAAAKNITTPRKFGEWLLEYGEDHPYWHAKVRGIHPPSSERQMFTQTMLDAAYERHIEKVNLAPICYGFDIAEEGGDETVGYRYHGGNVRRVYAARGGSTPGVSAVNAIKSHIQPFERVAVDANGVGRGVYEQLLAQGYSVIDHKGSRKAKRPDVYANRKSELFYGFQKLMQEGVVDLDPEDQALAAQLLSVRWVFGDRLTVETRNDRTRRGDASPDRADAVVIAAGYAVGAQAVPTVSIATPYAGSIGGEWTDAVMNREF